MKEAIKMRKKAATRWNTDTFKERIKEINKNIEILGEYINSKTKIKCKCLVCGFDDWNANPCDLLHGCGCPVCANKLIVAGINDIATLRPEYIKYFANPEDAKKFSVYSNKEAIFKCPDCGSLRKLKISDVTRYKFVCNVCGDKISYPNKFGRSLLKQLPISSFKTEWKPKWANPYCYDNYFEYNGKSYILEMDGMWHFIDNKMSGKTYEQSKEIDDYKDKLALEHNIIIIRIDSRYSEKEYIIKQIKNSLLSTIFNLNNIDWEKCEKEANRSITIEVCKYYKENKCTLKELEKIFNIGAYSIRRMLIVGNKNGWCNYSIRKRYIHVRIIDCDNNIIGDFNSIKECTRYMKNVYNFGFSHRAAKVLSLNKEVTYKGYQFKVI